MEAQTKNRLKVDCQENRLYYFTILFFQNGNLPLLQSSSFYTFVTSYCAFCQCLGVEGWEQGTRFCWGVDLNITCCQLGMSLDHGEMRIKYKMILNTWNSPTYVTRPKLMVAM
jgi:hypothetical protein